MAPPETFGEWLTNPARVHGDVWYTSKQTIIGMSSTFLQLFDGVINHLKGLHQNNRYDGDLRNRIRISSSETTLVRPNGNKTFRVTSVALAAPVPRRRRRSTRKNILKDIRDLRSMVADVVNMFPEQADLWTLFENGDVYRQVQSPLTYQNVKKMALYNYSHPIFLNKRRSCNFILKVHEIRGINSGQFTADVSLNTKRPLCDMTNWHNRVPMIANLPPHDPGQSPLRYVLYSSKKVPTLLQRFVRPSEFSAYMRIVLVHGRDIYTRRLAGSVFRELREVFPDGLAKIHLDLCTALHDDAQCVFNYGEDLCKLIRHGPHGYPGLKV